MEAKINIAEILKDKPVEFKLYSSTFGYIKFNCVHKNKVYFSSEDTNVHSVKSDGKMYDSGECIIFPSKEMRDWNKFAWKKGDVLTNSSGFQIFFDKWANEDYTKFLGKIKLLGDSHCYNTAYYTLASEKEALEFIKSVEEINNGKLNRETLEVEKAQLEFKDGDIVAVDLQRKNIRIFKEKKNENNICWGKYYIGFSFNNEGKRIQTFKNYTADCSSDRLATEEEKQQLFSALEKEGKAWDVEKKEIVDLKPKCKFKPFDKVLVRCGKSDKWSIDFFSHKVSDGYICAGDTWFEYCIPYNEGTAHLLGTTDEWEGGKHD